MSRSFDTTPTARERDAARAFLTQRLPVSPELAGAVRTARALGWLSSTLDDLTEAVTEDQARQIARARAIRDAYEETKR